MFLSNLKYVLKKLKKTIVALQKALVIRNIKKGARV